MSVRDGLPGDVQSALATLDTILQLASTADVEPLKAAARALDRFDNIGHILDPTAYIRGTDARKNDARLLNAFLAFRRAIDAVKAEVEANS